MWLPKLAANSHLSFPCILSQRSRYIQFQGTNKSFLKKKASRQRGVCVDHLKRCKTSTFRCHLIYHSVRFYRVHSVCQATISSRGPLGNIAVSGQRRRCNVPVKTYLQFSISEMATGQAKNRHDVFSTGSNPKHCTVFAICNLSCIRTQPQEYFAKVSHSKSSKYACQFHWIVFAREMHSTSVIR